MQKKALGSILTGIGFIVLLVSLFADLLGIGGYPGLGAKQIVGALVGLGLCIAGYLLHRS